MRLKTKFVIQCKLEDKTTFDYLILQGQDAELWQTNQYESMDSQTISELCSKFFLIRNISDDNLLLQKAYSLFAKKKVLISIYLSFNKLKKGFAKFTIEIVSNGIHTENFTDFFEEYHSVIQNIRFTLNGPPKVHDLR
jgi:hypothetical protein